MSTTPINPYLEQVKLKRQRNEQKIKELGLLELNKELVRPKKKPKRKASPTSVVQFHEPTRRSNRVSKKPVEFLSLDYEEEALKRTLASRKKRTAIKKKAMDLTDINVSQESREALAKEQHWLEDMEFYFSTVQGNSESNVNRVMGTTKKLVAGIGVTHPQTGESFLKNVKIHLGMDFEQMLDDASTFVYNNGGDRGHGWLIEHPVKKLLVYQHARSENGHKPFRSIKDENQTELGNKMESNKTNANVSSEINEPQLNDIEPKKKKKRNSTATEIHVGMDFQKEFHGKYYTGRVVALPGKRRKWYKVTYDDGDEEELDRDELMALILPRK